MATSWHLAPSLAVLRDEINRRWPNRDRTSDGTIGDAAHQATRSDHNPNSRGSVNAFDIDEDGIDLAAVFAAAKRHPSARYWIYERTLYHRDRGWRPEPYSGPNPHDKHAHLSIDQTERAEQDRRPWGLLEEPLSAAEVAEIKRHVTAQADRVIGQIVHEANKLYGPDQGPHRTLGGTRPVLDEVAKQVAAIAATPPGSVVVSDEQLERVLRRVIGSVDGSPPSQG